LNLLVACLISLFNNFTEHFFVMLGNFAKKKYKGSRDIFIYRGLFSIMYFNTGIIVVLVYSDIGYFKLIADINTFLGEPFFMA
jgi:hypothetical protein